MDWDSWGWRKYTTSSLPPPSEFTLVTDIKLRSNPKQKPDLLTVWLVAGAIVGAWARGEGIGSMPVYLLFLSDIVS